MNYTLEEKLGQMFIVRMQGKTITSELISLIRDYHVGGVSLYSRNYDTYEEMLTLINELKKMNCEYNKIPLFISVDQEGGRVNRLPKDFEKMPSAKKISIDKKFVKECGEITGDILNDLGINMNFSPVLDIQRFPDNHAIGDRCYGDNKETVSDNGILMMNALKDKKIIPVIKHFPGHGLVKKDSHIFLSAYRKEIEDTEDIIPFINAINNGAEAIMISHLMITKKDRLYPASLSKKVITDYLKHELDYNGLIITDDLKMKAVNFLYGYKKSCLKAIEAGNDLLLIGADHDIVIGCLDAIRNKMNNTLIESIEESFEKIIKVKEHYNITDNTNQLSRIEHYNKRIKKIKKELV